MSRERTSRKKGAANTKAKTQETQCECPICSEVILDPPNENHQPSIFCEGECQSWLHKSSAGLTEQAFEYFSKSKVPYQCLHCTVKQQNSEIAQLKQMLTSLSREVSQLKSAKQTSDPGLTSDYQVAQSSAASSTKTSISANAGSTTQNAFASGPKSITALARSTESASDKKFSVVVYGIPECQQGTPRLDRISSDLTSVTSTMQNLCPEITGNSIKDCTRLGKYKANSSRPILVKLVRSHDASSILANRHKIPARSSYAIKPLMTLEERANESTLLRERRALIESGIERKSIRLKQNSIYVNGKKHGSVTSTGFKRCSQMSNHSASTNQQTMQSNAQLDNCTPHLDPIVQSSQQPTAQSNQ